MKAALLLPVAIRADARGGYQYHDASSPAVGVFPGRRLASSQEGHPEYRRLQNAPLYGSINDYAYYFVDVMIGNPPRRQSVILDSGSSLLGFPCTGCGRNCGKHLDPPFNISGSETAQRYSCRDPRCISRNACRSDKVDTCTYTQVYSEGSSIEGFFFSDIIALGDVEDDNSFIQYDYIGCHTRETVLFTTQQASGILGVSFPKGGRQPTVMDTLMGSEYVNSKVFALCAAEDGGALTVGGYNGSHHVASYSRAASPRSSRKFWPTFLRGVSSSSSAAAQAPAMSKNVVWAPIISDINYQIPLNKISLQGSDLIKGGFGEVLVDSGTTYSYFPHDVYKTLAKTLIDLCKRNNGLPEDVKAGDCRQGRSDLICFHFTDGQTVEKELNKIPSFIVDIGNDGIIEWSPRSWLFRKTERIWCSAIEDNRRAQTILGMSFMKNKEVIFDRDNSYIGFVAADCPHHDAQNRPEPPNDKTYKAAGSQARESHKMSFAASANSSIFNWAPSISSSPQTSIDDAEFRANLSQASWALGGGVSMVVVGGLIAMIIKSVRNPSRSTAPYDPLTDPGESIA
eukprot:Blabericola_migrator_1__11643@NODE_700_length_6820_cov_37_868651_g509_i0_p2_GENE_NODE_700_length_6820_cov_37_868651_g509_i0NODE_700_length_6820_cov_37_868651_g509_i0_p2_ORF_typecomplete_len569_score53_36Asp/PF00026_23/6_9e24Asp/PF00026_23/8_3e17TAXi_N/PF14543_6/1_6e31TAXi_N/PF14543_6/8_7e03TAXi_C/PF14541_6/6_5e03TAXi_C/PF14541_6/5_1e20_NODE_700_length_6820_cov_37_868651_g509_i050306736